MTSSAFPLQEIPPRGEIMNVCERTIYVHASHDILELLRVRVEIPYATHSKAQELVQNFFCIRNIKNSIRSYGELTLNTFV